MFRILITDFWPALLPLFIYVMWRFFRKKRPGPEEIIENEEIRDNALLAWTIIIALSLFIAGFIYLGAKSVPADPGATHYVPPHMENGRVVPGSAK